MRYKSRVNLFVVSLFLLTASLTNAQEKIRTVEKGHQYENSPIEIVGKQLGEKSFIDETRVFAATDWLKDLVLAVKNVSSKNIVSFDIDLLVKKNGKILMGIPVNFRNDTVPTALNARTSDGKIKIGVLKPGEVVKVQVTERAMSVFGNELLKRGIDDLEQVTIDLRFVYFDDNTRWVMGQDGPVPDKPVGTARRPFPKLRKFLNSGITDCSSDFSFAFVIPATGRFFYEMLMAAASPPPPPTCVWLVNSELQQEACAFATTCQGTDGLCVFDDFDGAIHPTDPGGGALKGYMNLEPGLCRRGPNTPQGADCDTCQPFSLNFFRVDLQCGQPGTCNQPATWGCASGFVDINGVCQRSVAYQQSCTFGYNSVACSCNEPPPPPPPPQCEVPINHILYPMNGCPAGRVANFSTGCCTCNRSLAFIANCELNVGGYDEYLCGCTGACYEGGSCSPIVVDILGNGFNLTNLANGVSFDLGADGTPNQSAWTAPGSDDAWLALDRNHNGLIDSGKELFGNVTVQDVHPPGIERNGFLALAEYDKIMNGGNNDGKINHNDLVFDRLKLWQDANHDGVSESCELFSLPQLGLRRIDLDYRVSQRVDAHGNQFKYRSRVYDNQNNQLGRWAWDVFLVVQRP